MKKFTITNVIDATEVGDKENPKMQKFEMGGPEEMEASDGYHTFTELYDHRIALFIALCKHMHELLGMENPEKFKVWRSKNHSDGEPAFGGTWFVLGIGTGKGQQITYHLPIDRWEETIFAETLEKAPDFDGHTSSDVLERLKLL